MSTKTLIATETPIDAASPRHTEEPSIAIAEPSIPTAETLLIEEAAVIFGFSIEDIKYALEHGIFSEYAKITEMQLNALDFVAKYRGEKCCFLMIPRRNGRHRNPYAIELENSLNWIKKFNPFEHIYDTKQLGKDCLTLDWHPPGFATAVKVKPSFTPVEGSLESMLQESHRIIVKGSNGWQKHLDTQLTAIKKSFSIYYKELNEKIVSALEESNDRIRFAALKKSVLQAVRSYLLRCISNVANGIAHEYSAEEQHLFFVESSASRVKSLISAIDTLVSFVRAMSRIFKDTPAILKKFYQLRIMHPATGASDDLSCLLDFAGVALAADDFHETPKRGYEPEHDYSRRTLENSIGSPTNSNENSEPELNSETLSSVVNGQLEHTKYRTTENMPPDLQFLSRNHLEFDIFDATIAPAGMLDPSVEEEDKVDDFDYENHTQRILTFGRYEREFLAILMAVTKMQKIVDTAESSLTPDNEATHESANAEYNTQFKPILDEMTSKLTCILSTFDGFIAQCNEALDLPEIDKEKLKQVNTVLKKNKSPSKKNDAEGI